MSFRNPPTVSGIIVASGSNLFDIDTSDFPVFTGLITDPNFLYNVGPTLGMGFGPDFQLDVSVDTTKITTSGIAILDFYPDAAGFVPPFVPPIVFNERIFPVPSGALFIRVFPEEGRRLFPTLPQYAILTPGD